MKFIFFQQLAAKALTHGHDLRRAPSARLASFAHATAVWVTNNRSLLRMVTARLELLCGDPVVCTDTLQE